MNISDYLDSIGMYKEADQNDFSAIYESESALQVMHVALDRAKDILRRSEKELKIAQERYDAAKISVMKTEESIKRLRQKMAIRNQNEAVQRAQNFKQKKNDEMQRNVDFDKRFPRK